MNSFTRKGLFEQHIYYLLRHPKIEVMIMKKIISFCTLTVFLSVFSFSVAKADGIGKEQIKLKKQIMKQKATDIKNLELQLNDKVNELGNALQILLDRNTTPSEEMINKIQNKQTEILKIAKQIEKIHKMIKIKKLEAKENADKENYNQAIKDYDKVISLLDEEEALLKAYSISLQDFIELFKSLENK